MFRNFSALASVRLRNISALFVLFAALSVGMPHAWVSNALLLAIAAALAVALFAAQRPLERDATNAREWRALWWGAVLLAAAALVRFVLSFLWRENLDWSALGHYCAPALLLWIAREIGPLARRWAEPAMIGGLAIICVFFLMSQMDAIPDWRVLRSYRHYVGNDAIRLGLALAIGGSACALAAAQTLLSGRRVMPFRYAFFASVFTLFLALFVRSRSAMLTFALITIIGALFLSRSWRVRTLLPMLMGAILVGIYFSAPKVQSRIAVAAQEVTGALIDHKVDASSSQGQRLALASVTRHAWLARPWLGHGLGSWREQFRARIPPQWFGAIHYHTSPHNEYLHVATQMGALGLLGYIAWIGALLYAGVRRLARGEAAWLFALAIVWAIGSVTNVLLWDFRFFAPLAALLICSLSLRNTDQSS